MQDMSENNRSETDRLRAALTTLQADHARVLGLVQALPSLSVTARNGKWYVRVNGYFAEISEADGMALHAFDQYRASLPAQPAQGGA